MRYLALLLALFLCLPASAAVLFQDDFEAQADWDGVSSTTSGEQSCTFDDCLNMPTGWSVYLTQGCSSGHCSLTIENGPANDGGNTKSLYYWLDAYPYANAQAWVNDAQLNKFFPGNRTGYPDLWVEYDMKVDTTWEFKRGSTPQVKVGRTGNYFGDGTYAGPEGHSVWPWESNINKKSHRPWSYMGFQRAGGGASTVLHYLDMRCDAYRVCGPGSTRGLRYFWNYPGTLYCDGAPEDSDEQCLIASSPQYVASLGDANCDDAGCDGALVTGSTITDPSSYTGSGGSYCNGGNACDNLFDFDSPGAWGDGEWHTWRYHMKMNSALGAADGWIQVWIDGVLIHDIKTMEWKSENFFTDCPEGGGPEGDGCPDYDPLGWNYFGFGGNNNSVHDDVGVEHWYAIDNVVMADDEASLDLGGLAACEDGIDNDGDGLIDYDGGAGDPGCSADADTTEHACSNGVVEPAFELCETGDQIACSLLPVAGDPYETGTADCSGCTSWDEATAGTECDWTCGNNVIAGDEVCDGTDLSDETCVTLGYSSGTLECSVGCASFNAAGGDPCVGAPSGRVTANLVAHYLFEDSSGVTATDEIATALNLTSGNVNVITWLQDGGVTFDSVGGGFTASSSTKIAAAINASQEFSIEVWLTPTVTDANYERLMGSEDWVGGSLSQLWYGMYQLNNKIAVRARHSGTNSSGYSAPEYTSTQTMTAGTVYQIVYTRNSSGSENLYLTANEGTAGSPATRTKVGTVAWDGAQPFGVGTISDGTTGFDFIGTVHKVAIYDDVLSLVEIQQNLDDGPHAALGVVTCPDGIHQVGEDCDLLAALPLQSGCVNEGYDGGTLACIPETCDYDFSGCYFNDPCGNGVLNVEEECDTALQPFTETCVSLGFDEGDMACFANCTFDTSGCANNPVPDCDGVAIDAGEECDGADLNSQTCVTLGFDGGTLTCDGTNCNFDTSACTIDAPVNCGNGVLDPEETCDTALPILDDCSEHGDFEPQEGILGCNDTCLTFDTSGCTALTGSGNLTNVDGSITLGGALEIQ